MSDEQEVVGEQVPELTDEQEVVEEQTPELTDDTDVVSPYLFGELFDGMLSDPVFKRTIRKLADLPSLSDVEKKPMDGKKFYRGVMGYRRRGWHLLLAVGCGRAMVREIALAKYLALVQNMHDDRNATIVLENFTESEDGRMPRGQVLGRIFPEFSALVVAQGLTGKVIHSPSDIVKMDCYYLSKEALAGFYISCKLQHGAQDLLDELAGAHDGWKAFNLTSNLCDPEL